MHRVLYTAADVHTARELAGIVADRLGYELTTVQSHQPLTKVLVSKAFDKVYLLRSTWTGTDMTYINDEGEIFYD